MRAAYWLLELLFPSRCVLCGRLLQQQELDLCHACRTDTPDFPEGKTKLQFLDSFLAVWYYKENVRRSLLRFKFYGHTGYARSYGRLLAMKIRRQHPEGFDVLTWVPVSPMRRLRRGYDQVQLLAQAVGEELDMEPVRLLRKIRHNRPQSGMTGEAQRRANVLGAYVLTGSTSPEGKRILLLDDVLTTGATAGECGRMLLVGGAKEVHCAVIAAARK